MENDYKELQEIIKNSNDIIDLLEFLNKVRMREYKEGVQKGKDIMKNIYELKTK